MPNARQEQLSGFQMMESDPYLTETDDAEATSMLEAASIVDQYEIEGYDFRRDAGETWREFLMGIAERFGIDLIHLHNISGCREGLLTALAELAIPYGYTVHDLNFACPTITFHDAKGLYFRLKGIY